MVRRQSRVLTEYDEDSQQGQRHDGRSEVRDRSLGKRDPDHGGAEQIDARQRKREPEAASGEPELTAEPSLSRGEDAQAEDNQKREADQESPHRRQCPRKAWRGPRPAKKAVAIADPVNSKTTVEASESSRRSARPWGPLAQLAERRADNAEVRGSSPRRPTTNANSANTGCSARRCRVPGHSSLHKPC